MMIFKCSDEVLSTSILFKKININFLSFLGVRIILTFQFEQAISSDPPTHPNFNFVRI